VESRISKQLFLFFLEHNILGRLKYPIWILTVRISSGLSTEMTLQPSDVFGRSRRSSISMFYLVRDIGVSRSCMCSRIFGDSSFRLFWAIFQACLSLFGCPTYFGTLGDDDLGASTHEVSHWADSPGRQRPLLPSFLMPTETYLGRSWRPIWMLGGDAETTTNGVQVYKSHGY